MVLVARLTAAVGLLGMALLAALTPGRALPNDGDPDGAVAAAGALEPRALTVDGQTRAFQLYVPTSYQPGTAVPLVFAFHGLGGSGAQLARSSRLAEEAERGGFIAVFPDGSPVTALAGLRGWAVAAQPRTADLAFFDALLEALTAEFSIDAGSVFAVGHSNGGAFAYRVACDRAEAVAAIGVVAGFQVAGCRPSQPVAVLHIHGTGDQVVPFAGGSAVFGVPVPPVAFAIDSWRTMNGCPAEAVVSDESRGVTRASRETYEPCGAGASVALLTIDGGGHPWPGGVQPGLPLSEIDATPLLWQFLRMHPRQTPPRSAP